MVCIIPAISDNNVVIMGTIVGEKSQELEGLPVASEISNTEFVEAKKLPICFDIRQSNHNYTVPKIVICCASCVLCGYLLFCSKVSFASPCVLCNP
jgi:hypothetical protein